jgi:osmoprotectant transport system substrate-binding protein
MTRGATTRGTGPRGARLALAGGAAMTALALLTACSGGSSRPPGPTPGHTVTGDPSGPGSAFTGTVVVGSADFAENELLGEIYAQALEARHIKVVRRLNLGNRDVLFKEVQSGTVTVVPEYNGALLNYVDKSATENATDTVDAALDTKLPAGLEILDSAEAQDNDSLVVSKINQAKYDLHQISDLAALAPGWVIGAPPQFKDSQRGVVGLQSIYNLAFKSFKPLDDGGPVSIAALQENAVQVIDLSTTTPQISSLNVAVLDDDRHLFGVQNVTPLANRAGMPQAAVDTLNAVSADLDTSTLAALGDEVTAKNGSVADVARQWLKSVGLA